MTDTSAYGKPQPDFKNKYKSLQQVWKNTRAENFSLWNRLLDVQLAHGRFLQRVINLESFLVSEGYRKINDGLWTKEPLEHDE